MYKIIIKKLQFKCFVKEKERDSERIYSPIYCNKWQLLDNSILLTTHIFTHNHSNLFTGIYTQLAILIFIDKLFDQSGIDFVLTKIREKSFIIHSQFSSFCFLL